ncbi:bacteriohemerythrin [bacterium 3DAC]|jgi:hemerythrin|nr:hemerythrin family protein [Dictyoglomota bacterium]UZN23591.1 bacteriohemerythrin [bacterium 3DAC]
MEIKWSDSLSVGHPTIDSQHKELVRRIAKLIELINSGSITNEQMVDVLGFIADYTDEHFSTEEKMMIQTDYPEYEAHRQQHLWFMNEVNELIKEYMINGVSEKLLADIQRVLIDWLVGHITGTDKKLGAYLMEKGVVAPEE